MIIIIIIAAIILIPVVAGFVLSEDYVIETGLVINKSKNEVFDYRRDP